MKIHYFLFKHSYKNNLISTRKAVKSLMFRVNESGRIFVHAYSHKKQSCSRPLNFRTWDIVCNKLCFVKVISMLARPLLLQCLVTLNVACPPWRNVFWEIIQIDNATNHSILKRQTFQMQKYFCPWETFTGTMQV